MNNQTTYINHCDGKSVQFQEFADGRMRTEATVDIASHRNVKAACSVIARFTKVPTLVFATRGTHEQLSEMFGQVKRQYKNKRTREIIPTH